MDVLDRALDFSLANEGGFVNNKFDRGGATKFGITKDTLSRWRHRSCSVQDVSFLKVDEAKAIYEAWFWNPLCCEELHPAVAMAMFDMGIVRGIGIPPIYAQQICNAHGSSLRVDGHMGPKTIANVNALDPKLFVNDFSNQARAGFLAIVARRPTQVRFIKGWLKRAARLKTLV